MAKKKTETPTVKDWLGEGNELGADIWHRKYQVDNETFETWLDRVSGNDPDVRRMILEKKFLFGGRILAGRGIDDPEHKTSLSNCYVIAPPEDNIESIFDASKKMARTYSYGGGCGIDIGKLSPRGARVRNAAKESSGAISFLGAYELTTKIIGQQGRRGALMVSIPVSHPDIEEFIELKTDLEKATKANLSVRVDEGFMRAVKEGAKYLCSFTREATGEVIEKTVDARALFHRLAETNYDFAEPGVLFWDRIRNWNLLSEHPGFEYAGTNPCAEEPLPAGGSCLLGSINLSEFVTRPFTAQAKFDRSAFLKCVDISMGALNSVLDEGLPRHPLEEQRESVRAWRQVGLGVMGYADALIKLGYHYGSEKALNFTHWLMRDMAAQAILSSCRIAMERGGAFKNFDLKAVKASGFLKAHKNAAQALLEEKWNLPLQNGNKDLNLDDVLEAYGMANSQLLCVAPTGTISTMLGISGGMEPVFATHYRRRTESLHGCDRYYTVHTKIVKDLMDATGTSLEDLPTYVITAPNIFYKNRIDTQAAFQDHVDASISSTINVPNAFTVEDTENLYLYAWEKGLKGVTMFRDGCRRTAILSNDGKKDGNGGEERRQIAKKRNLVTGCGTLHMTAWFYADNGDLYEVFLNKGSTGGCNNFMNGLSRMISKMAQLGGTVDEIFDQLSSTGVCPSYAVRRATKGDTSRGTCCPMAVGNALVDMHEELLSELGQEEKERRKTKAVPASGTACPSCGEPLIFEGGCNICKNCGWSHCE